VRVRGEAALASLFASTDASRRRVVAVLLNHDPGSPWRRASSSAAGHDRSRVFAYGGGVRRVHARERAPRLHPRGRRRALLDHGRRGDGLAALANGAPLPVSSVSR
jgi:hypothetical protein